MPIKFIERSKVQSAQSTLSCKYNYEPCYLFLYKFKINLHTKLIYMLLFDNVDRAKNNKKDKNMWYIIKKYSIARIKLTNTIY